MFRERTNPFLVRRLWVLALASAGLMGFLLWRLWSIQMRHSETYDEGILRQSVRRIRLEPVRGRIFTSDGAVLVDNRPSFTLVFHPAEMRQPGPQKRTLDFILDQADALARDFNRPIPVTRAQLVNHLRRNPAMELLVFQDLTPVEMARLSDRTPPVPGLEITARVSRSYTYPGLASHILGFTGRRPPEPEPRDPETAADTPRLAYTLPELTGREGIERFYDQYLSGQPGEKQVQVDILGYIHSEIGTPIPPKDGNDLTLTLQLRAQQAAEQALEGYSGALVVVDVDNGAIVAMASKPGYDLAGLTPARYQALATDTAGRPLLNRAVAGRYLPGSIMKPLTALAALQAGAATPEDVVNCQGQILIGDHPIRCWRTSGHGPVNMTSALEHSCNSYFLTIGMKTGLDNLLLILKSAGLGESPQIDLSGADSGFLPSREWALKEWKRPWLAVDTAYISIGQGPVSVTPVQAAIVSAAIANGGTIFRPHLVQNIRSPAGEDVYTPPPVARRRLPVMQSQLAVIRQGMWLAVNSAEGTAKSARNSYITLAGKTGTAEVNSSAEERMKNTWFMGFAPADKPKYAFAVVIERGASGGHTAAPVVRSFFEGWFGPAPLPAPRGASALPAPVAPAPPAPAAPAAAPTAPAPPADG